MDDIFRAQEACRNYLEKIEFEPGDLLRLKLPSLPEASLPKEVQYIFLEYLEKPFYGYEDDRDSCVKHMSCGAQFYDCRLLIYCAEWSPEKRVSPYLIDSAYFGIAERSLN